MTTHALTFDLEDWHQLFHRRVTGETIPPTPAVVTDTHRLLDFLDEVGIRATLFVTGFVGEAYPGLVREALGRGHEIGSHTYSHHLVHRMDRRAFKTDVERSVKQLQDLTGRPIFGFRSPEYSVNALNHWAFEVLAELGFLYDSSVFPLSWMRYGIPHAPRRPFLLETSSGTILEFPVATWQTSLVRVPVAGGSYFRYLPGSVLLRALADIDAGGHPAVFCFHPYEFHLGWLYLASLTPHQQMNAVYLKYIVLHNICTSRILRALRLLSSGRFHFAPLMDIHSSACRPERDLDRP